MSEFRIDVYATHVRVTHLPTGESATANSQPLWAAINEAKDALKRKVRYA